MAENNAVRIRPVIVYTLLLLLYPVLACATDYYVDGVNGSDANDGSAASPWKTIGFALTPGSGSPSGTDTLYIRYATYNEALDFKPVDKRSLTVKGVDQNGSMPIIDGGGVSYAVTLFDFNGSIQGLAVTGSRHGIDISGESKNAKVVGCKMYGNNKGLHVNHTSTPLVSGNLIYSNDECGIGIMNYSAPTIDGNQIYNNGNGSPTQPSAGICIPDNAAPRIYNNIIRNNYNTGIVVLDNSKPVIVNNTIAHHRGAQNSPGKAIKVVHSEVIPITSVTIANNIIYDNDYGLFSQAKQYVVGNEYNNYWQVDENYFGFAAGNHEISADPLFGDNFTLNSESPCIDIGTATHAPANDIKGLPRPQGDGFDVGAYEQRPSGMQGFSPALFLLL